MGKTRNPAFGIFEEDIEFLNTSIETGSRSSRIVARLSKIETLNSLFAKKQNGEIDIDKTKKLREAYIRRQGISENSRYYPEGWSINRDQNGVPYYGQKK